MREEKHLSKPPITQSAICGVWRGRLIPVCLLKVEWSKLKSSLDSSGDDAKRAAKFVEALAPAFAFLRNTRNAVEHPKPGQEVIFQDYRLRKEGVVTPPTITVIEKSTPHPETDLNEYFGWVLNLLVDAYEAILVNLCAVHVKRFSGLATEVIELDASRRRYPHVAYSYAAWMGEQLVPYGE